MLRLLRTAFAFALTCALTASEAHAGVVVVRQIGTYFSPRDVLIQPGDTVRWIWTGQAHTVTEGIDGVVNGNELWHSPLTSGTPVFEFTFTPAFLAMHPKPNGRYDYFCIQHFVGGMTASVSVIDPAPGSGFCFGDGSGPPCPCVVAGNSIFPVGCPNSSGQGSRLTARGTASITSDSFQLQASGVFEGNFVLLFQGSSQVAGGFGLPFGDGLRCVNGTGVRLGVKTVVFGYVVYPDVGDLPVSQRSLIQPGITRYYQTWYRDGTSECAPGFNTSNGYEVPWLP